MRLRRSRAAANAAWLMAGKLAHMVLTFLIGLVTARYLGAAHYGLLQYAAAYGAFFAALCTLGLHAVLVKRFVDRPDEAGVTIGTALVLRAASSFLSAGVIVAVTAILDRDEPLTRAVAALYCVGLIVQAADTMKDWFQARLQSKYYTLAALASCALAAGYQALLVLTGKDVRWFALALAVDYAVLGVIMLLVYRRQGGRRLSFSGEMARGLLRESAGFIVSGLMVSIYAATDRLMLKQMAGETAVAYYALAAAFSTSGAFAISAIIDSMTPDILRQHQTDRALYERSNRRLYAIVFYASLGLSAAIALAAPWLIRTLYGDAYRPAAGVLRIVVWYTAFSYLGGARNAWLVCEGKQRYLQLLSAAAAALNVGLNGLLIPVRGASGAALASLATQIFTTMVLPFLIPALRPNGKLMLDAILLRGVLPNRREGA